MDAKEFQELYAKGQRDFSYTDFSDQDLRQVVFKDANLYRANFLGADLRGADLSHCDLYKAVLSGADLRHANLRGADLYRAYMVGADVTGANMICANLTNILCNSIIGMPKNIGEKK